MLLVINILYLLFTTSPITSAISDTTLNSLSEIRPKSAFTSAIGILIFSFQCHQNVRFI